MKKYFVFILPFIFLFSGCGKIEVEEVPSLNMPIENEIIKNVDEDIVDDTSDLEEKNISLLECEKKFDSCIVDLDSANKKNIELQDLLQKTQSSQQRSSQNLNDFFIEYLNNVAQEEFSFDECGRTSTFSSRPWFINFTSLLSEKNIYFNLAKRPLEANDFFGVCVSNGGKMAFFLGASYSNETEFYLYKLDFDKNTLDMVQIGRGSCEDCPVNFGTRKGPYVELSGERGTIYRYYYNKNVLMQDTDF